MSNNTRRALFGVGAGLVGLGGAGAAKAAAFQTGGIHLSPEQFERLFQLAATPKLGFADPITASNRTIGGLVDSSGLPIASHAISFDSGTVNGSGDEMATAVSVAAPLPVRTPVPQRIFGTTITRVASASTAYTTGDLIGAVSGNNYSTFSTSAGTYVIGSGGVFSTNTSYFGSGMNYQGSFEIILTKSPPTFGSGAGDNILLQGTTGLTNPQSDYIGSILASFSNTNSFSNYVVAEGVVQQPLLERTLSITGPTYATLKVAGNYPPIASEVFSPFLWLTQVG